MCVHSLDVSDIVGVVALPCHPMCVRVLTVSVYCSSLIWFPVVSFPLILLVSDFGEVHVLLSNSSLQLLWGSVQGDNPSQRCVIRWSICRGIHLGLGVWCRKTCTFQLWGSFWTWNVRLMLFELRPKMCLSVSVRVLNKSRSCWSPITSRAVQFLEFPSRGLTTSNLRQHSKCSSHCLHLFLVLCPSSVKLSIWNFWMQARRFVRVFPIGSVVMDDLRQQDKWNMESCGRGGAMFWSGVAEAKSWKTN